MSFHSAPIYVFIVAPPLLCWGFEKLVHTAYLGIRIVGTSDTLDNALPVIRDGRADVMVIDHDENIGRGELEQAAQHVPLLLLAGERGGSQQRFGAHIAAVVSKNDSPATLLRAIEQVCDRTRERSGRAPAPHPDNAHPGHPDDMKISRLTMRERELIVALLCSDAEPGKIIAHRLCISEQTLRNHLSSIYAKLGIHSRLGLHSFAVKHGLHRGFPQESAALT
jgi:two-component system, NarL family, nitrate/nitrite response regulator NarL